MTFNLRSINQLPLSCQQSNSVTYTFLYLERMINRYLFLFFIYLLLSPYDTKSNTTDVMLREIRFLIKVRFPLNSFKFDICGAILH